MDLSTLQSRVNYRRRDTTEGFVSSDEIKDYLNDGLQIVQSEDDFDWSKTSAQFTYTDGSSKYALSAIATDIKYPIDIFYTDDYLFEQVQPSEFRTLSAINANNIYAVEGDYLLVDTSFGGATLDFYYYSTNIAKTSGGSWIANLSTSTDEPLMPSRHQIMLVDYADAMCNRKEGLVDDYQIAYSEFMRLLNKMKGDYPSVKSRPLKRMIHINEFAARRSIPFGKGNPLNS